jgi:hypothetical protein
VSNIFKMKFFGNRCTNKTDRFRLLVALLGRRRLYVHWVSQQYQLLCLFELTSGVANAGNLETPSGSDGDPPV